MVPRRGARPSLSIEWGVGVEPEDLERFLRHDAERYVDMGFRQFTLGFNGPTWGGAAGRAAGATW